jgi:putative redox protein
LSSDFSQVTVRWAGERVFLGSDPMGHSIVFDSSSPTTTTTTTTTTTNGPGVGVGPMNALLCALGACSGMDIVAIMTKRKQKLSSLRIEIRGRRLSSGHPRPFEQIEVKYLFGGKNLTRKYVEEAVNDSIQKYCSVAATVSGKAHIEYSYEIADV